MRCFSSLTFSFQVFSPRYSRKTIFLGGMRSLTPPRYFYAYHIGKLEDQKVATCETIYLYERSLHQEDDKTREGQGVGGGGAKGSQSRFTMFNHAEVCCTDCTAGS